MKCPHCLVSIHSGFQIFGNMDYAGMVPTEGQPIPNRSLRGYQQVCPECKGIIVDLEIIRHGQGSNRFSAYPKDSTRPVSPDVTDPYATDFREASLVLTDSPKASAALSRRNLQAILRDKAGTKSKDLYDQIEEVITAGHLPSHIVEELHAVRHIGNFAAHTMKSTNTGAIIDVEPGEAEWNLDVLESLFDFYFVQPALSAKRKAELNKKLTDAGKPPMK